MWTALLWKEYRTQRALVLAMGALAVLGLALTMLWPEVRPGAAQWFLVVPAAALAMGAMAYAEEREHKTLGLLRRLPTHPARHWTAKAIVAQVGWLVVLAALCWVAGQTGVRVRSWTGLMLMVVPLSLLAWSSAALFSAFMGQVLTAAMAGAGLLIALELALYACLDQPLAPRGLTAMRVDAISPIIRLVETALLAGLGYRLSRGATTRG
jgi:hypothetical protein